MEKKSSQEKISSLEKKIIELQRELDEARRNSTSIWCKFFDCLIDSGHTEEESSEVSEVMSQVVIDWVKAQRAKINRKVSSLGVMPPYTDCLNDLIMSVSDPAADHSDLLPEEGPDMDMIIEPQQAVRIPSPPPPTPQPDTSLHMGPAKMLKVNVPKPRTVAPFPSSEPDPA